MQRTVAGDAELKHRKRWRAATQPRKKRKTASANRGGEESACYREELAGRMQTGSDVIAMGQRLAAGEPPSIAAGLSLTPLRNMRGLLIMLGARRASENEGYGPWFGSACAERPC